MSPLRPHLLVPAALAAAFVLPASPAQAAVTSSYASATKTVTVTIGGAETATIAVNASNQITANGVAVPSATTANTDLVKVVGNSYAQTAVVDLARPIGPGAAAEATGIREIEVNVALGSNHDVLRVQGGAAVDRVTLGTGGANLNGDDDADDLRWSGVDGYEVKGMAGDDVLSAAGGAGSGSALPSNVTLFGGAGLDTLTGGLGSDTLYGDSDVAGSTGPTAGNDTMSGGDGSDRLWGHSGNDVLRGDASTDYIYGQLGNDQVSGGGGTDYFEHSTQGSTGADGADVYSGGTGQDVLYLRQRTQTVRVSLDDVANDGLDAASDGVAEEADNVRADVESLDLGAGNDVVTADTAQANAAAAANDVRGNAGNDTIKGGEGEDYLAGNAGNDTIEGGSEYDRVIGDEGDDTLRAGEGDDSLTPGLGNDKAYGEDGSDLFNGANVADGADLLDAGAGTDHVYYSARETDVRISLDGVANDGADADRNGVAEEADNISADMEGLSTGAGIDTINADTPAANALATANYIRSGDAGDTVRGGAGPDDIGGMNGDDTLTGGLDEDVLDGGLGIDTINAADGDYDRLTGGSNDGVADKGTWDVGLDDVTAMP